MTAEDFGVTETQRLEIIKWFNYQKRIKEFCIKNNLDTFQTIFGEDEGLRLLKHFRSDCREDFTKFLTYLKSIQQDYLHAYIIKNY